MRGVSAARLDDIPVALDRFVIKHDPFDGKQGDARWQAAGDQREIIGIDRSVIMLVSHMHMRLRVVIAAEAEAHSQEACNFRHEIPNV